jgi:hypothetical protein
MHITALPKWVFVWAALMAALSLGFAVVSYANPGFFGDNWATAGLARYATVFGHYTARNVSLGVVTLIALFMGRPQGLILVLLLRVVTDLADGVHQVLAGTIGASFLVSAAILIGGSLLAIRSLWPHYLAEQKLIQENRRSSSHT